MTRYFSASILWDIFFNSICSHSNVSRDRNIQRMVVKQILATNIPLSSCTIQVVVWRSNHDQGIAMSIRSQATFYAGHYLEKIPFVVKNQHKGGFHCFLFFYVTLSGMEMKRQPMAPRKTTESDVDDGLKRNLKRSVRICLLSSVRPVLALDRRAGPFLPPGELGGRPEWNRSLRLPAFFPSLEGVS